MFCKDLSPLDSFPVYIDNIIIWLWWTYYRKLSGNEYLLSN